MKGRLTTKKLFAAALVIVLALSMCIFAFAAETPANEDTVYYAKSEISGMNRASSAIVDIPEDKIAVTGEEDTVYYGINELKPEDFIRVESAAVERARASYTRFEFPGAVSGSVYSDFNENVITAGATASLYVNTCVWSPESNDLEIGIYNWTTGENWYVVRAGGQVNNYRKIFYNLSAGTYSVYIRNRGTNALTTGYLLYNLA